MKIRHRKAGLLVFAAAIVGASLLTETRRDVDAAAPVAADPARASQNSRPQAEVVLDVDGWLARLKARRTNNEPSGPDQFGGTSLQPQPMPSADPPAKSQTPPFPFRMLGQMTLGGATVVLLSKGEQDYSAKVGQVLEQFRIERIDEDGLQVTYLPTGESRDYRREDLYATVAVTEFMPPQAALAPQPVTGAQQPVPQQQQAQAVPAAAGSAGAAPAGVAATSVTSSVPLDPTAQGAAVPIEGMVIGPAQPGSGMVITPAPPGTGMVITPTPPGAGMVMTQPATGSETPRLSGTESEKNAAPAPK